MNMDNLTAGLLFNDTMVMIAGNGVQGSSSASHSSDGEFQDSLSAPMYEYDSSPCSSSSGTGSPYYAPGSSGHHHHHAPSSDLFTEFELGLEFGSEAAAAAVFDGSGDAYMEELISSDLSSDEDKFLESIRYGGGRGSSVVFDTRNDLLSEEELVNTIQGYGDVKVVQVDNKLFIDGNGVVDGEPAGEEEEVVAPLPQPAKVVVETPKSGTKKRKASVGGSRVGGSGAVKRVTIIQSSSSSSQKKSHVTKQQLSSRVQHNHHLDDDDDLGDDDEIIIETTESGGEMLSPSPGSPEQQNLNDGVGGFQELKLSDEEKRLLLKEGISLPTHYPLTKLEERELKRIRRKIRNKISAQDSRKRKKEFLDRLQSRVQEVEDEKGLLSKRIRSLESINSKLNAQVKRLQQALTSATQQAIGSGGGGGQTGGSQQQKQQHVVPAATTLLVLILSLALVVLPTVEKNHGGVNSLSEAQSNEIISLLNRSNEQMSGGAASSSAAAQHSVQHKIGMMRQVGGGPRSRAMVDEVDDEGDGGDDEMMDKKHVVELIGEMRNMLFRMRGRKRAAAGEFGGSRGNNKRGRFAADSWGIGAAAAAGKFRSRIMRDNDIDNDDGWWASDDDGGYDNNKHSNNNNAFQSIVVQDLEVD